jgi:hypothetical protein
MKGNQAEENHEEPVVIGRARAENLPTGLLIRLPTPPIDLLSLLSVSSICPVGRGELTVGRSEYLHRLPEIGDTDYSFSVFVP